MGWRIITSDHILGRLAPSEKSGFDKLQNKVELESLLIDRIVDAVRKWVSGIRASGFPVTTDETVPDQFRDYIMHQARWHWLVDSPSLKYMQTDERKSLYEDAEKIFLKILDRRVSYRTESQQEWADWSAHGYRKLYQPRSMLRLGLALVILLIVGLFTIFWLAAHGRFP